MVTGCARCGRFLSFQRKEALNPDLIAGHWYGCPGCGSNVCDACGLDSGQHCLECGETLEPDQLFPTPLRPRDDWRELVDTFSMYYEGVFTEQELVYGALPIKLIGCVTKSSFADIYAAFDDLMRELFRRAVWTWDIERRLGTQTSFAFPGSELGWTPQWEQRLELAAEGFLARADAAARDMREQREALRGWQLMTPALPLPVEDIAALLLHPDDDVAERAGQTLIEVRSAPEVLEACVRLFRSAEVPRLQKALVAISSVFGREFWIAQETRERIEQHVCQTLAAREAQEREDLIRRVLCHPHRIRVDMTAKFVDALGLGHEVVPWLLPGLDNKRRRDGTLRFLADMGASAVNARDAVSALLTDEDGSLDGHGLSILGRMGMTFPEAFALARRGLSSSSPQGAGNRLDTLLDLLEKDDEEEFVLLREPCREWVKNVRTPEERLHLIEVLHRMGPSRREALLPGLPPPAELLLSLLEDTRDKPPDFFFSELLTLHQESPRLRTWLMKYVEADFSTLLAFKFLQVVDPSCDALERPLCELVLQRKVDLDRRISGVEALGRIARESGAPGLEVLVDRFLDSSERCELRLAAARAAWSAGLRALPATRLEPVLEDPSAALRCWALLLADTVGGERLAAFERDALPLVRRVARARRERAS